MSENVKCVECGNVIGPEDEGYQLVRKCHFCLREYSSGKRTDWEAEARYYRRLALEHGDELTALKFPELEEPTPPSPPQPKELCECGHTKEKHERRSGCLHNWDKPEVFEGCRCSDFKPAQADPPMHPRVKAAVRETLEEMRAQAPARTEACPHGCVDGVVTHPATEHDEAFPVPCPIHAPAPKCPNPDCVEGWVTGKSFQGQAEDQRCTWEGHRKPGTGTAGREGAEG